MDTALTTGSCRKRQPQCSTIDENETLILLPALLIVWQSVDQDNQAYKHINPHHNTMRQISRKRACFALEKDYKVHLVPHRWDYDASQRAEIWYGRQDYEEFRKGIKRIVELMERNYSRNGRQQLPPLLQEECTRGLESQTHRRAVAKKVASLNGICAVLVEQDHQKSVGNFSVADEAIRKRYIEMNCVHVEAALKQGQKDAEYENHEAEVLQQQQIANKNQAGQTLVSARRNRSRISRLLFGFSQRSNGHGTRGGEEETM
jgi:hypothetical protein